MRIQINLALSEIYRTYKQWEYWCIYSFGKLKMIWLESLSSDSLRALRMQHRWKHNLKKIRKLFSRSLTITNNNYFISLGVKPKMGSDKKMKFLPFWINRNVKIIFLIFTSKVRIERYAKLNFQIDKSCWRLFCRFFFPRHDLY